MVGFDREQASTTTSKAARAAMRTAPQLLVTGGPASDDPSDNGRPVELRYDADSELKNHKGEVPEVSDKPCRVQ